MTYGTVNVDSVVNSDGVTSGGLYGFKNRIINGAMVIDQRNAGASVTQTTSIIYSVDRWGIYGTAASKFTAQQNAGSVTPPSGFANYLGITSSSAYSIGSGDIFMVYQGIEGYNIADLAWGTANAATVTLSFWVRSSLTGTFGGVLSGASGTRSYPFTYTISASNTWEQKSITIAGPTSGTWLGTNATGVGVKFGLGVGSTYSTTAGSWANGDYYSATGATSVVGTSGATFYITGVQLEKGSTATSFDYRPYGTELALCQRYFYKIGDYVGGNQTLGIGWTYNSAEIDMTVTLPVTMRSSPSLVQTTGTNYYYMAGIPNKTFNSWANLQYFSGNTVNLYATGVSGLTGGQAAQVITYASGAYVGLNSEL